MVRVFGVALEHHQPLVVKNEIRALVKPGQLQKRLVEFIGKLQRIFIAVSSEMTQLDEAQHFSGQCIADTGDSTFW